jgi:hypothetical protein
MAPLVVIGLAAIEVWQHGWREALSIRAASPAPTPEPDVAPTT